MKRRLACSLLTVLALLWQGMAAAAMVPGVMSSASNSGDMPEHCQMAAMHGADHATAITPAAKAAMKDCCATGHCACVAACSAAAALPVSIGLLPFTADTGLTAFLPVASLAAASPPYPFRPPIRSSL